MIVKIEYPEARVKEHRSLEIDEEDLINVSNMPIEFRKRMDGEFAMRAYHLDPRYQWMVAKDHQGILVLVPIRKEEQK